MPGPPKASDFDSQTDAITTSTALPGIERQCAELRFELDGRPRSRPIEGFLVIGASPQADVVLKDPTVSRLHCRLEQRGDGIWLKDLGSLNGTWVEGLRVAEARLNDGSRIVLGSSQLSLHYEQQARPVDLWPMDSYGPLLGRSTIMRELFARLERVAPVDAFVLIEGETGTGKELVAQAIHQRSKRAEAPFVVVDCGALPEGLIESELFGHIRGAFTGATGSREGAFQVADGGTVFLDEVGELPLAMQPRLLRVLESGTVRRVGETQARQVDVRVIAATHRNLQQMVNEGSFREDLYFRLAVIPLGVPALRQRGEDLPLLVQHFLPPQADPNLVDVLSREFAGRNLPGNVRELRNLVARAAALGVEEALDGASQSSDVGTEADLPAVPLDEPFKGVRQRWLDHLERQYITGMLERHGRSLSAIAQASGLDRSYVHRLIRKHGL